MVLTHTPQLSEGMDHRPMPSASVQEPNLWCLGKGVSYALLYVDSTAVTMCCAAVLPSGLGRMSRSPGEQKICPVPLAFRESLTVQINPCTLLVCCVFDGMLSE